MINFNDIDNVYDLFVFIKNNIKYGYVTNDNVKYIRKSSNEDDYMYHLFRDYHLQRPSELLNSLCGICYDQVELIRVWLLKHNYDVFTYLTNIHNHSVLLYKDNEHYNWFETTFKGYIGIYQFKCLDEFYDYYREAQIGNSSDDIYLYPYENVLFGCDFYDYIDNIKKNNKKIILNKKKA